MKTPSSTSKIPHPQSSSQGDSPPDDIFNSAPPPPENQQHDHHNNNNTNLTVTFSLCDDTNSEGITPSQNHRKSQLSTTSTILPKNPFHETEQPQQDEPHSKDIYCQTDIRMGEWLFKDASVGRGVYLDLKTELRKERMSFLKEASLLRQTLSKLEAALNRGSGGAGGGGVGGGGGGGGNASRLLAGGGAATGATTATNGGLGGGRSASRNNLDATTTSAALLMTTMTMNASNMNNNNNFLNVSQQQRNNNGLLSEGGNSNSFDVSTNISTLPLTTMNNNNNNNTNLSPVRNISPHPYLPAANQNNFNSAVLLSSPTSVAQQQQLQHSATIQATANTVMLLMNEAAKALAVVTTIEEIEEKNAASQTELRLKMTSEMEELKKKHRSEMNDLESDFTMLRVEAESATRASALERERLVHQMERNTWDSVQSLKTRVKALEQELEFEVESAGSLKTENKELKKELQKMKAEQIMLISEKRRLEQRLLGGNLHSEDENNNNNNNNDLSDSPLSTTTNNNNSNNINNTGKKEIMSNNNNNKKQILRIMDNSPSTPNQQQNNNHERSWGYGVILERESDVAARAVNRYDGVISPRVPSTSIHTTNSNSSLLFPSSSSSCAAASPSYTPRKSKHCPSDNLLILTMKQCGILQADDHHDDRPLTANLAVATPSQHSSSTLNKKAFNPPRVASMMTQNNNNNGAENNGATTPTSNRLFSLGIGGRGGIVAPPAEKATSTSARITNTIGKDIWGTRNEKRMIVLDSSPAGATSVENQEVEKHHPRHRFGGISRGSDPDTVLLGDK